MVAYFRFVLKHRVFVTLFLVALTGLGAWSLSHAVMASSLEKMFFGDSPAYDAYVEKTEQFGTEEVNPIAIPMPNPLSSESIAILQRLTEGLEALPDVDRAFTILDLQRVQGDGTTIRVEPYWEVAQEHPEQIPILMDEIRDNPLSGGLVISQDGQFSVVLLEIRPDRTRPAESLPSIRDDIMDIFDEAGFPQERLHSAGLLFTINEAVSQTEFSLVTIFPIVVVVLLFSVWLMFRRLWPAVVSTVVSLVAVIWTVGFAVALDRQINIMISMVPTVIMVVGFSDVVHLCSAYLLELGEGKSKDLAIVRSAEDVGRACFFTSATTFAGFVCLSLVPTPMFRTLGVVLGMGVATALLIAMTLVPIIFSWMPEPKPLRKGATSKIQEGIDSGLGLLERLACNRPKAVIAVFAVLLVLSGIGIAGIHIEADFARRLGEDNTVRQDAAWFDEQFSGTSAIDVYVTVPEREGLLDPTRFAQAADLQAELLNLPEVTAAFSVVDLVKQLYSTYSPDRAAVADLPDSRAGLTQLLELFQNGDGQDLGRLLDFNRQTMRILLRLEPDGVRSNSAIGAYAVDYAQQTFGDEATVEPSGLMFLLGDWLDEILEGQRNGLLLSIFVITVMMIFAVGSFRNALTSMIPNVLPLVVLGGVLGGLYSYVDSDSMAVAMLAVGIGVDDTIHFLVRLRIESKRTGNRRKALRRTFAFAGRAIVMTTIILVAGFAPFALSDYYSLAIMGTLLPMCLIIALLADLLLVPALVQVNLIKFVGDENA